MKSLVFFNLSLFLLFSPVQDLNLNSLKAQPTSAIENNPRIAKMLDACQNNSKFAQEKMEKVGNKIKIKLLCICTLSEKLELLKLKKDPILSNLLGRLFSKFSQNVAGLLNIDFNNVNQSTDKTKVKNLVNEILRISSDKLDISISLVMRFLNPSSKEQISQKQIKHILTKTLSTFNPEELNTLEKIIRTNAFRKIADNLDVLTGIVLSIIKEDA